jgi:hypothetical protein
MYVIYIFDADTRSRLVAWQSMFVFRCVVAWDGKTCYISCKTVQCILS